MMLSRYHGNVGQLRTASDFDSFRGIHFDKGIPALYDDGGISLESIKKKKAFSDVGDNEGILKERWQFVKGQLRVVIDIDPDTTEISHESFVQMIRPTIGYIPDADTRAILKRSVFIVFTKDSIYYRPPSEQVISVKNVKWAIKDILLDECTPRFNNYRKDGPPPSDFEARVASEQLRFSEVLRRHESKDLQKTHLSNALPLPPIVKMEANKFHECHEGLAAMCAGEALDAESPPPLPRPEPTTPQRRIKQEKFGQDAAAFLLRSSSWARSLGPNTVIDISPLQSDKPANSPLPALEPTPAHDIDQVAPSTSPSAPSSLAVPPSLVPNPEFLVSGDEMDVEEEEDVCGFGDSLSEQE